MIRPGVASVVVAVVLRSRAGGGGCAEGAGGAGETRHAAADRRPRLASPCGGRPRVARRRQSRPRKSPRTRAATLTIRRSSRMSKRWVARVWRMPRLSWTWWPQKASRPRARARRARARRARATSLGRTMRQTERTARMTRARVADARRGAEAAGEGGAGVAAAPGGASRSARSLPPRGRRHGRRFASCASPSNRAGSRRRCCPTSSSL